MHAYGKEKLKENIQLLEGIAAEIFRLLCKITHNTASDMKVDPYEMSLSDGKELLLEKSEDHKALEVDLILQVEFSYLLL